MQCMYMCEFRRDGLAGHHHGDVFAVVDVARGVALELRHEVFRLQFGQFLGSIGAQSLHERIRLDHVRMTRQLENLEGALHLLRRVRGLHLCAMREVTRLV